MAFSFKNLTIANAVGLVSCYGIFYFHQRKLTESIKNSQIYKEAIEIARNHKGALHVLGDPIEDYKVTLNRSFFFNGSVELEVDLKGSKSFGKAFIQAVGENESSLKLDSIYLQQGNDKSKLLVLRETSRKNNDVSGKT